jgi:hypothetical protein
VSDFLAHAGLVQTMGSWGSVVALIGRPLNLFSRNQKAEPAGLELASPPLAVSSRVNALETISIDHSSAVMVEHDEHNAFGMATLDQDLFSTFSTDEAALLLRFGKMYGLRQNKAFSDKMISRNLESGKRQLQQLKEQDYQPAWILALLLPN